MRHRDSPVHSGRKFRPHKWPQLGGGADRSLSFFLALNRLLASALRAASVRLLLLRECCSPELQTLLLCLLCCSPLLSIP